MDHVDQAYGYILYRAEINGSGLGQLRLTDLHRYARVYLNGHLASVVDRRLGQKSLSLTATGDHRLDILVENFGRINFKPAIRGERVGILDRVSFDGSILDNWNIYPLPLALPPDQGYGKKACTGPCF